jgi:RNA-directed DNA polymerase
VAAVLHRLNPIIRGEALYFRIGVAAQTFGALDSWMFGREVRWVKWQHPHKPWRWQKARYWSRFHPRRADHWVFGDHQTGAYLLKFAWFPIRRHVLVRDRASPDDPTLRAYWQERDRMAVGDLRPSDQRLAARQSFVCPVCGESLGNGETVEAHHSQWRCRGGTDEVANLVLVHLYCHQQLHHERREVL